MQIKGIFFDLYGTLLMYGDLRTAWIEWQRSFYERLQDCGLTMSETSFALHCDDFFERPEPQFPEDYLTVLERRIKALGIKLGLTLSTNELEKTAVAIVNAWQQYVSLDPDTLPVLHALKAQKSLALISNFDHPPYVHSLLSALGLTDCFDSIVISGDVGVKKPDPRIFSFALQQTQLQPHEVVYVGDSTVDVQGARAACMCPIRIQRYGLDENYTFVDSKLNQPSPQHASNESTGADARTIATLPELIALLE
ncbi:MAG: HAD family hydrolase [Methanomicrobia archaeon]|nr:HAD family hydrolase [Methanomicrobia archaeon]